MPDAYANQLAHLVALAENEAWKAYAWNRAKELEACETGMWSGIAEELRQAMTAAPAVAEQPTTQQHG